MFHPRGSLGAVASIGLNVRRIDSRTRISGHGSMNGTATTTPGMRPTLMAAVVLSQGLSGASGEHAARECRKGNSSHVCGSSLFDAILFATRGRFPRSRFALRQLRLRSNSLLVLAIFDAHRYRALKKSRA